VHVVLVLVRQRERLAARGVDAQVRIVLEEQVVLTQVCLCVYLAFYLLYLHLSVLLLMSLFYVVLAQVRPHEVPDEPVVRGAEALVLHEPGHHLGPRVGPVPLPPLLSAPA